MMKLISVSILKEKHLKALCEDYTKKIQPYQKLECIEVKNESISQGSSIKMEEQLLEREGAHILSKIKDQDYVILLDLHGKEWDSIQLAKKIDEIQTYHSSTIVFVIGGSLGVSSALRQRAQIAWKLSNLTFLHQMTRLIVLEQIYRSFKILGNETYHK